MGSDKITSFILKWRINIQWVDASTEGQQLMQMALNRHQLNVPNGKQLFVGANILWKNKKKLITEKEKVFDIPGFSINRESQ